MDYSLMVAVDEARKELVVGIIDVVRTYTWVRFPSLNTWDYELTLKRTKSLNPGSKIVVSLVVDATDLLLLLLR